MNKPRDEQAQNEMKMMLQGGVLILFSFKFRRGLCCLPSQFNIDMSKALHTIRNVFHCSFEQIYLTFRETDSVFLLRDCTDITCSFFQPRYRFDSLFILGLVRTFLFLTTFLYRISNKLHLSHSHTCSSTEDFRQNIYDKL